MSEEKTLEQRVEELEKKCVELEKLLNQKVDSQELNKRISELRFAVKKQSDLREQALNF